MKPEAKLSLGGRGASMLPLAEWPLAERRAIRGVFTDIDDTLTTHGEITPDALQALQDLRAAGLAVIAITGRPVGWATPKALAWPVDAMVVENGAVALLRSDAEGAIRNGPVSLSQIAPKPAQNAHKQLLKRYQLSEEVRLQNNARMRAVAARVLREVPGVQLSADHAGRETDLAFDHAEFAHLDPASIQGVLDVLRSEGMHTTVSSIHIHGCYGQFDKWRGACWILRELWGRELAAELDQWAFVGDSGNDEAMFRQILHSVGVANIARFAPQMQALPRYVTVNERGAGFAEVADAILRAR